MAFTDFSLDEENDRRALPNLGPAPAASAAPAGGGVSGAPAAPAAPAPRAGGGGTGFVNLERYLGANRGAGAGMADTLAQGVTTQAQRAEQGLGALRGQSARSTAADLASVNPALYAQTEKDAGEAGAAARGAGTAGGVGALLTDTYGKSGGYGSGLRGFDTFLARGAGGDALGGLAGQYGGLSERLGLMSKDYRPSAPGGPPKMGGVSGMSPKGNTFAPEDKAPEASPPTGGQPGRSHAGNVPKSPPVAPGFVPWGAGGQQPHKERAPLWWEQVAPWDKGGGR